MWPCTCSFTLLELVDMLHAHLWSFRKHVSGQGHGKKCFAGLQGGDLHIFFLLDGWLSSSLAPFLCF